MSFCILCEGIEKNVKMFQKKMHLLNNQLVLLFKTNKKTFLYIHTLWELILRVKVRVKAWYVHLVLAFSFSFCSFC